VKCANAKYCNEVMTKIDPKAVFVAQDIETGKIVSTQSIDFLEIFVNGPHLMIKILDKFQFKRFMIQNNSQKFFEFI
jgi:hypothetical protein